MTSSNPETCDKPNLEARAEQVDVEVLLRLMLVTSSLVSHVAAPNLMKTTLVPGTLAALGAGDPLPSCPPQGEERLQYIQEHLRSPLGEEQPPRGRGCSFVDTWGETRCPGKTVV